MINIRVKTVNELKVNLNEMKEAQKNIRKNKKSIYDIEYIPVLTKRNKYGRLKEVINPSYALMLRYENEE